MGKLAGYFYNHINKKGYVYSHENITSYTTWNTTISKIVHSSLSKDMKGPMQIKRGKCYSLMLLCLKINCINIRTKRTTYLTAGSKTTKSSFPINLFLHVILMPEIYFRIIIMVAFWFADTKGLCWWRTLSGSESFS